MSLFVYGSKGWDFFYKPDFKPIFEVNFTDRALQEKATEVSYFISQYQKILFLRFVEMTSTVYLMWPLLET